MENEIIIYYDESEHSRKINNNTISNENYYDDFIGSYVKIRNSKISKFNEDYITFENKYSERKSKGELKSTTIKKRFLKYGFASTNRDNISIINDLLDIISEVEVLITLTSKVEYLANQILVNYENDIMIDADALKYTLAKSINIYKPIEVITSIENKDEDLITKLINFYKNRILLNQKNILLKKQENNTFKQLLMVLLEVNTNVKLDWEYNETFELLKNEMIKDNDKYSLILDKEGTGKTLSTAEQCGIKNVKEDDSCNQYGLRCADMIAGIIGKLLKAIDSNINEISYDEKLERKLLSKEFFNMNENQYKLYLKLYKLIKMGNLKILSTSYYKDSLIILKTLINYIASYNEFSKFKLKNQEEHKNLFDKKVMQEIYEYIKMMPNKLPLIEVDLSEDYHIGNHGEKIYKNINRHDYLDLSKSEQIYHVLNVGIRPNGDATITIEIGNKAKCFRLPNKMKNWAMEKVILANTGVNLFPAKINFVNLKDKIRIEIQ